MQGRYLGKFDYFFIFIWAILIYFLSEIFTKFKYFSLKEEDTHRGGVAFNIDIKN